MAKYLGNYFSTLSIKDKELFAKRLSFLVRAGVPIIEGLETIKSQYKSKAKRRVFEQLAKDVSNGQSLANSLAKFKNFFGDFVINIVKVGESSGTLDQNLDYLAQELKKSYALKRKVIGALVYPVFIIIATFGITAMLMIFIFPKVLPVFASLNVSLPITTRLLIFSSNFLISYGLYIAGLLVIAVIIFLVLMSRSRGFKYFVDRVTLSIPIIGKLTKAYLTTNFTRTLGLLLNSGVHVDQAVKVTADSMGNLVYKKMLHGVSAGISKGQRISSQLDKFNSILPPMVTQMILVGETTGRLSDSLMYVSDMYEQEVDDQTKNLSNSIEPILMIFMGVIVGFLAISIITPIYDITKSLSR